METEFTALDVIAYRQSVLRKAQENAILATQVIATVSAAVITAHEIIIGTTFWSAVGSYVLWYFIIAIVVGGSIAAVMCVYYLIKFKLNKL